MSLSALDIADSYKEAESAIYDAELKVVNCHPVWQKVYRIKKYLQQQAEAELKEVLE